ncbi:MAG: sugar kinase [Gammaproteobacteria bacterium]|nr:sugar kinase [Gammaproteobacteria bacterium]
MIEISVDSKVSEAGLGIAGDTLNTAIYLKRQFARQHTAHPVSYITTVGTDVFSERMLSFIGSEGIDTEFINHSTDRIPGLYAISTDAEGERSFTYWRENSAARQLFQFDGLICFDLLARFNVIFFSGITLAILPENVRAGFLEWLGDARRSGKISTVFDSNYRPRLWNDQAEAQHWMNAAWEVTSLGLPSLDDEQALFGSTDERDVLERLKSCGVESGVLKRGAAGPCSLSDVNLSASSSSPVDVVDTTAAGDSFNGAFLAHRLCGATELAAMQAGHDCAIKVIGHPGAIVPAEVV